ncbi:MAG TPA: hypothetical protein VK750_02340 [Cytophagaceae bacterium]|jgi:hypothetical protein|nr:hypothetical protein [Cytophagaceae bacterium]
MKNIFLSFMLVFATVAYMSAQQTKNASVKKEQKSSKKKIKQTDVPKEVVESFLFIYPEQPVAQWYAYPYYWDFENDDLDLDSNTYIEYLHPEYYEVEVFKEGKMHHSLFSKSGKHIHTRKKIKKEELPKVVSDAFNSGPYKDWTVVGDHEIVYTNEPDIIFYKMTVKKGKEKSVLYYGEKNGELVQVKTIRKR